MARSLPLLRKVCPSCGDTFMANQFILQGTRERCDKANEAREWCFECISEHLGDAPDLAPLPSRGWGASRGSWKTAVDIKAGLADADDNGTWDVVVKAYEEAPLC